MNFNKKRVLVTGACGTIGSEITKKFLDLGAIVCAWIIMKMDFLIYKKLISQEIKKI